MFIAAQDTIDLTGMSLRLSTAIGPYPHVAALKDGRVVSARVALEHAEVSPVNRAFRPMVNQLTYDVSEMALVTLMLARAMGRPLRGVPVVLMRQSAHELLAIPHDEPPRHPRELAKQLIAVRSYTQTTGTWIRGALQYQYGIDLGDLRWLTFEESHVDGYVDPPNCTRASADQSLSGVLKERQVAAAVVPEPGPDWRPLIGDLADAEAEFERLTGVRPLNHVLVVKDELTQQYPWLTRELFDMCCAARELAPAEAAPYGLEAIRKPVELLARYAFEQGILPRACTADELFEPLSR